MIAGVIEVLRDIHARYVLARKRDWFQHIELSDELLKVLVDQIEIVLCNDWHVPETPRAATKEWIGASDACDYGWGFVILKGHDSGRFVNRTKMPDGTSVPGAGFPASLFNMHIYVKEIYAALQLIAHVCKHATGEPATLTLLMDNTAGMHSFQKWYTKNRVALFLLKRAHKMLKEKNIELIVKWVKSEDNPSDAPSRFEEVNDDLCVKGIELAMGLWEYEHNPAPRRTHIEKDNDVPTSNPTMTQVELDALQEDDMEVDDDLLHEVNLCHPDVEIPVITQEGLASLFQVLVGEQ